MKKLYIIQLTFLLLATNGFSQKLLWTSQNGGANGNGAIIQHDLNTNQTAVNSSLAGNPLTPFSTLIDLLNVAEYDFMSDGLVYGQDGNLYGISTYSGAKTSEANQGGFFKINPNTGQFTLLHSFTGDRDFFATQNNIALPCYNSELSYPILGIIEASPGVFYGICKIGGEHNYGGIWKFNTNSGGYSRVYSFESPQTAPLGIGREPSSPLIIGPGGNLYGIVKKRGPSTKVLGHLYKVDITNDSVTYVKNMDAAGWAISDPVSQIAYNPNTNKIYGTKHEFTGLNAGGGIYTYDFASNSVLNETLINTTQLSVLGNRANGITPIANDGFHYFVCRIGGANNKGTLVKYSAGGMTMVKVHDFQFEPSGTGMTISGTKVFGTYNTIGSTDPLVWSYDVSTQIFTNVVYGTNDDTRGYINSHQIAINAGKIYGMTNTGGTNEAGKIYFHDIATAQDSVVLNKQSAGGRELQGGIYLYNDSIAYASIPTGGPEQVGQPGYSETGGIAKINLLNGSVERDTILSTNYPDKEYRGMNFGTPFISSGGFMYTNNWISDGPSTGCGIRKINLSNGSIDFFNTLGGINPTINAIEPTPGNILWIADSAIVEYNEASMVTTKTSLGFNHLANGYPDNNILKASNGKIYGTTTPSGTDTTNRKCIIYSVDQFLLVNIEHVFEGVVRDISMELTEYNGKLYGSTTQGGTFNQGYLFSYDLSTSNFIVQHSFFSETEGGYFGGGWTEYNGELYSVSYTGGANGYGTLAKYNPSTVTFTVIKDLTMENGRAYRSAPVIWDDIQTGINELSNNINIKIYPNPTNSILNVDLENVTSIEIFNINGQLVKSSKNTNKIDVNDLKSGIYFIKTRNNEGLFNAKFMKE